MSKLQRALTGEVPPGVYCLNTSAPVESLKKEAGRVNWQLYVLDGSKIYDKRTFLDRIARVMRFPDYFGKNWDALNDSITDMNWARGRGYVLLFQEPGRFFRTSPDDWNVAIDILKRATETWQEWGVSFYVLVRGKPGESLPDL